MRPSDGEEQVNSVLCILCCVLFSVDSKVAGQAVGSKEACEERVSGWPNFVCELATGLVPGNVPE